MSALASKLIRSDFLIVQVIFNLHINRKFFIGSSLIINITAVCIPGHVLAVLSKGLITLYILDSFQVRYIGYISICCSGILQPVRYGNIFHFTFCCGIYVYGFFLGNCILCILCGCKDRGSSKYGSHSSSHGSVQNFFISIHRNTTPY